MEIRHIKSKNGDKYTLTLVRMSIGESYSDEIEEYNNEDYWSLKLPTEFYDSFNCIELKWLGINRHGYMCLINRVKRNKESKTDYQVPCPAKFGVILNNRITSEEVERFFNHISKLSYLFNVDMINLATSIEFPLPIGYVNDDDIDCLTALVDQVEDILNGTDEYDKNKVADLTKFNNYPFSTNKFILYNSTIRVDKSGSLNNAKIYAHNVNTVIDKSEVQDMILSLVGNEDNKTKSNKLDIYKSILTNSRSSCRPARLDITVDRYIQIGNSKLRIQGVNKKYPVNLSTSLEYVSYEFQYSSKVPEKEIANNMSMVLKYGKRSIYGEKYIEPTVFGFDYINSNVTSIIDHFEFGNIITDGIIVWQRTGLDINGKRVDKFIPYIHAYDIYASNRVTSFIPLEAYLSTLIESNDRNDKVLLSVLRAYIEACSKILKQYER